MLTEIRDPGKTLEAIGPSRKPKFKFPVNAVLDELSTCTAIAGVLRGYVVRRSRAKEKQGKGPKGRRWTF